MGYQFTFDAESDLEGIAQYTRENWGETQVIKYLQGLQERLEIFSENMCLGKLRSDIGQNILSFSYESHVIYYLNYQEKMVVFGVLHKGMVPHIHLMDREISFS